MDRDLGTILDIVLACQDVETFIRDLDEWQFKADRLVRSATIHQIMIIGEATKRLRLSFGKNINRFPGKQWLGCATI